MRVFVLSAVATFLLGCVSLAPTPADLQAKKFEAMPDKAVIYIVRSSKDSDESSGLWLDNKAIISTHPQTYFRWEVDPGTHRVSGYGPANESVTFDAQPGRIYFLRHSVLGDSRSGPQATFLRLIGAQEGRELVSQSELLVTEGTTKQPSLFFVF